MKKQKIKYNTLVIVESPSKARTINKYLGSDYIISSSVGHIIDLPKSRLAIDIENNFKPEYITIRGKAKILNSLKKLASETLNVLLATDPDREGEAISWHLSNALAQKNSNIKRIEFNEITEAAVKEAIKHPRNINMDLVNAQQARRILDRIVGYYISPILWKKIKKGLSAGRVQSVALKVICEREKEIEAFIPEEYWSLDAELAYHTRKLLASLNEYKGQKIKLSNRAELDEVLDHLKDKVFTVSDVKKQERKRRPSSPYITSKLQQDAANRLGYTSQKTMIVAQQLYEGIEITEEGPTGLITYMRTDSTRVSETAITSVRNYIASEFGAEYLPEFPNQYQNRKGAQDAHEAIRPTDVSRTPESLKADLTREQYKLYELIWSKFVSSQMTPEISEMTSVVVRAGECVFRISGSRVLFNGFTAADRSDRTEKHPVPDLKSGDQLNLVEFKPEQHFTTPPPRFNDASLVKFLEESGIGRPSTYAPTITTLNKRYYIVRSGKQLVPTTLGKIVNDIMIKHFSSLLSIDFTVKMEEKLDLIEESKSDTLNMLREFYDPFKTEVDKAEINIEEMKNILDEETDLVCENCGKKMIKKLGKYGFFLACSGFPECRNSKPIPLGICPKCGTGNIIKRSSKKGRGSFFACSNYPSCDFFTRDNPSESPCPKCGSILLVKRLKGRGENHYCVKEGCGYQIDLLDEKMTRS
ncbi:MAG: type I DNA topoisomerase [Spirochaetes bacterium]|nr:type I DNA topoisomerase [Spirochaetota bacterium]